VAAKMQTDLKRKSDEGDRTGHIFEFHCFFMRDEKVMLHAKKIEAEIRKEANKTFPPDQCVLHHGKAMVCFPKRNRLLCLIIPFQPAFAFFPDGAFLIVYVPFVQDDFGFYNTSGCHYTAGIMGYFCIPLKPSTILF
jgi:hypothetical protein